MKIETLSLVVGGAACNASCPFCVSKMTPPLGVTPEEPEINGPRLAKAIQFAHNMNVSTVILTGKGEPTLYPRQLLDYLDNVGHFFPFVELQTNGLKMAEDDYVGLPMMRERGLTTVALSIASYKRDINQKVYLGHRPGYEYPNLADLIKKIHDAGLSVRLSVVMLAGGIDSSFEVEALIEFARQNEVEQLSLRPVAVANHSRSQKEADWTRAHSLSEARVALVRKHIRTNGTMVLKLQHGAEVYDVYGQNVCLTDCLTLPKGDRIRQAIFFPDGHLRYDWQYPGAILM